LADKPVLLLLGGSADQLFSIRTAKEMGVHTLVVDQDPNAPGFALADEYRQISTRDEEALIRFVDAYRENGGRVDGVFVQGSDIPQVVARVAEHLGCASVPLEAARLSTHKLAMKLQFQARDIPLPWFTPVESADHLRAILAERGYPLIIKPVDRSGGRGVYLLAAGCDVDRLYGQSRELAYNGEVMAEEYLRGEQLSTESIVFRGKTCTVGWADRNYEMLPRYTPNIIENGGWVPSSISEEQRCAVERLVEKAAAALGVSDGVLKGDLVMTAEGPKLIEMATRPSGGDFSESLIPLGCGVNLIEVAIEIALGRVPDLNKLVPKFQHAVANRYFFPPAGKLRSIAGLDTVARQPWVKKLACWYEPGDILPQIASHADRFGVFVVTGETRAQLDERIAWVYDTVKLDVDTSWARP
jgi:biotin carboxylase